jgi:hypothetical protein
MSGYRPAPETTELPEGVKLESFDDMLIGLPETAATKLQGAKVLLEIENRLSELARTEVNFSRLRIRIGMLLKEVQDNQYWMESFKSFGDYVESLETKYQRSRTQCYSYLRLVTDLLPTVGEDKLTAMSVSKAQMLSQVKKNTGSLPPLEILDMAADSAVSTKQFRQTLLDAKKLPDLPAAKFRSIEYVADDERQATIMAAFSSVKRTEQLTGAEEVQNGVVLECIAMEYLGTPSAQTDDHF